MNASADFRIIRQGEAWFFDEGNVGLATSGSGDTLAGIIVGLLARHNVIVRNEAGASGAVGTRAAPEVEGGRSTSSRLSNRRRPLRTVRGFHLFSSSQDVAGHRRV